MFLCGLSLNPLCEHVQALKASQRFMTVYRVTSVWVYIAITLTVDYQGLYIDHSHMAAFTGMPRSDNFNINK